MDLQEYKIQWLSHFAKDINPRKIQKYVIGTGDYIWHLFSWEVIPAGRYLEGDQARKAYDKLSAYQKEIALFIEPFGEGETFSLPAHRATSKALEEYTEIYVTANDYSWTYIKTHEGDLCGPYFYRKEQQI